MKRLHDFWASDIVVLVVVSLALATLSTEYSFFERFYRFSMENRQLLLGELATLTVMLSYAFIFLGVKKSLEVKRLDSRIREVTREREEAWETARQFIMRDELTGLLNRKGLMSSLVDSLRHARRSGSKTGVLLVDIDNFRGINDQYGYDRGDRLLERFSKRLHHLVRQTDFAGRVAGNQFGFVLNHLAEYADAARVAKKINEILKQPLVIDDYSVTITCSIGIAVVSGAKQEADTLFHNADQALHQIKAHGRGGYKFFTDDPDAELLLEQLREAINNGELEAWYQPQYDLNTLELIGFEALARWNHPSRGLLVPGEFITLAERGNLIGALGQSMLRQACQYLQKTQALASRPLTMSVNVSPMQLQDAGFATAVQTTLEEYDLDATCLTLEITESLLIQDTEDNFNLLTDLKNLGVKLALDDFGTGYSAISYLKKYPFNAIKIDRTFICHAHTEGRDVLLVKLILGIAEQFNMSAVAEGIENEEHLDILRSIGCTYGQGYLFSRPISEDGATKLILSNEERLQNNTVLLNGPIHVEVLNV